MKFSDIVVVGGPMDGKIVKAFADLSFGYGVFFLEKPSLGIHFRVALQVNGPGPFSHNLRDVFPDLCREIEALFVECGQV